MRHQRNGLVWHTLAGPDGAFRHALLTRIGGVSEGAFTSLNLGSTVGDRPEAVAENHRRVFETFNVAREQVVSPHQVHGRQVAQVDASQGGTIVPATDALITNEPGVVLLLRFADCTPVLFYDPVQRAAGLAHAGWRGVASGVVPATVAAMGETFGTRPEDLWVGLGPAIGVEHYVVGPEVVDAVKATLPPDSEIAQRHADSLHLNLPRAVEAQLRAAGVRRIVPSGIDTAGNTDEWYSHRAEGGKTGRFGVLVMLV
ncbi:MAG: peptidoglycan editing factor PgeF [Anaerolineae bacterium]